MDTINRLFGIAGHLSFAQECARSVLIFFYGLLLVRLAGRRAFARWSALDIVVAIVVGSSLSRAQTGNAPLLGTIAGTALIIALHWLLARGSALSRPLSIAFEGPARTLASAGALDRPAVVSHNVSDADLAEALRQAGIEQVADARTIILEPSGRIAVLRKL